MKEFWEEVWKSISVFAPLIGMLVAFAIIMGLFELLAMMVNN